MYYQINALNAMTSRYISRVCFCNVVFFVALPLFLSFVDGNTFTLFNYRNVTCLIAYDNINVNVIMQSRLKAHCIICAEKKNCVQGLFDLRAMN